MTTRPLSAACVFVLSFVTSRAVASEPLEVHRIVQHGQNCTKVYEYRYVVQGNERIVKHKHHRLVDQEGHTIYEFNAPRTGKKSLEQYQTEHENAGAILDLYLRGEHLYALVKLPLGDIRIDRSTFVKGKLIESAILTTQTPYELGYGRIDPDTKEKRFRAIDAGRIDEVGADAIKITLEARDGTKYVHSLSITKAKK